MRRELYRQIVRLSEEREGGSVNILLVFPASTFADAPYWSPGTGFQVCIPHRTWLKDNKDGTADTIASYVTPKIGITAWDGSDWAEPEIWTVRTVADHWWLGTVLWDKPHRITHFLNGDVDEGENLLRPSQIIDRQPHARHPIKAVLEYWDAFSIQWAFTPRRLEAFPGLEDRYGVLTYWGLAGDSDLDHSMQSLSMLVYNITKIARHFGAEIHILPDEVPSNGSF